MLTLKQIATHFATTPQRVRAATHRAGVAPVTKAGRTHLYSPDSLAGIGRALVLIPTRNRKKKNAKPTASTQAVPAGTEPQQGGEATFPPIEPVASDPQTLPQSPSDM